MVTIDAWHASLNEDCGQADLHADVVFGEARVGGESDSPLRFRLSIKRAEVIIVIPEHEPIAVDRASVSRDSLEMEGSIRDTVTRTARASVGGAANIAVGVAGAAASASASAEGVVDTSAVTQIETTSAAKLVLAVQTKTADGHYRWELSSQSGEALKGRPWKASEPRLRLLDQRKDRTKGIPPCVRVEVRCLREDLVVRDIEVKNAGLWDQIRERVGFENRVAAAESYIRNKLLEEGLDVENIHDPFGRLTIGSVLAEHG